MKRLLILSFIFLLAIHSIGNAANWQTMTFDEELSKGLAKLDIYCLTHDVKTDDVLWANHTTRNKLKAGDTIYLPGNQSDILAIWQQAASATPKPTLRAAEPAPQVKDQDTSPATVIAQTAKPDKILTSKPRQKPEIPGLMDPIIILSPNGDPTTGPMKLIISGDKVEVVRLPQSAAPKKPVISDLNTPFEVTQGYMPHYNMLPKIVPNKNTPNKSYITNITPNLNGKMMWPVDGKISSPFGRRGKRKHEGIDIPMPAGTPIRAARNGIVIRTGNNSTVGFRGYGNFIMIDHGGNIKTFYAHCMSVAVVEGQRIMQGQIIGYVGSTGRSTANHLHFEVRVNDTKVNPVPYLAGNSHLASHK